MFYNRVFRDADVVFDLTVRNGGNYHVRYVLAQHAVRHRSPEPCGKWKEVTCYRISIINDKAFVERWATPRTKESFRKEIPYAIAENTIGKYFGIIKDLHSDAEDVVEVFEMVRQFVEDYEVGIDAN